MPRFDHRDVQLRYQDGGETEIKNMIKEGYTIYILKEAMRKLTMKSPAEGRRMEMLLRKHGVISDTRGPSKPDHGDRRLYSVQRAGTTNYIRLPVDLLGVDHKQLVEAEFKEDRITIKNV